MTSKRKGRHGVEEVELQNFNFTDKQRFSLILDLFEQFIFLLLHSVKYFVGNQIQKRIVANFFILFYFILAF